LFEIKHRKALEQGVFLHHIIVNQRYRLRGVEVEIDIAKPADIKARKTAPVAGFDIQTRHPPGEDADIAAARDQYIQRLAGQRGNRHRDLADIFDLALGGDVDRIQRLRLALGLLRQCGQRGSEGQREQAAGK